MDKLRTRPLVVVCVGLPIVSVLLAAGCGGGGGAVIGNFGRFERDPSPLGTDSWQWRRSPAMAGDTPVSSLTKPARRRSVEPSAGPLVNRTSEVFTCKSAAQRGCFRHGIVPSPQDQPSSGVAARAFRDSHADRRHTVAY